MTTAIRRVTPPATTPVSVAEAKDHLMMEPDFTGKDDYLGALIDAAVALVDGEGILGRAMITQSWAQHVSQAPGWPRLTMGPFQSLTSVEYYDAAGTLQTATLGDFETWLDGDFVRVKPKDGKTWPTADVRPDAITITYVAGFGAAAADVPQGIRHAILMLVAHWYRHREPVSGSNVSDVPLAVEALLGTERVGWYG